MGDFNATSLWSLYRRVLRRFEDGVLAWTKNNQLPPQPTWGPRPEVGRYLRIDHVMVEGLRLERVETVRIPRSDHSGLFFKIRDAQNE